MLNVTVSDLTVLSYNRYQVLLSPARDMTFTISLPEGVATDGAGNLSTGTGIRTFHYDTQRPTVTQNILTTSPTNVASIQFELHFSEKVKNLSYYNLGITNGDVVRSSITTTDMQNYLVTIVPAGDGNVTWSLVDNTVQDEAGNASVALGSFSLLYDGTRPSGTFMSHPVGPMVNGEVWVKLTMNDDHDILDEADFTVKNATVSMFIQTNSRVYDMKLTPIAPGAFSIQLNENVTRDAGGNWNMASGELAFNYDNVPPTATLATTAGAVTRLSPYP